MWLRQHDGATSRGSGWKAPAPGLFSQWDVGQTLSPAPSSPGSSQWGAVIERLVLTCGASDQPLAISGLRTSLFPSIYSFRVWSHQLGLYPGTPNSGPEKQPLELAPDLLGDMGGPFSLLGVGGDSEVVFSSAVV